MGGGRLGLGGSSYEYKALLQRDRMAGERREAEKGGVSCIWGKQIEAGGVEVRNAHI